MKKPQQPPRRHKKPTIAIMPDRMEITGPLPIDFVKQVNGLFRDKMALLAALQTPELAAAHDRLSELLEDADAGNDDIRDAAIDLCAALNAHHEKRQAAIAAAVPATQTEGE